MQRTGSGPNHVETFRCVQRQVGDLGQTVVEKKTKQNNQSPPPKPPILKSRNKETGTKGTQCTG